jgi:hypothetical protein
MSYNPWPITLTSNRDCWNGTFAVTVLALAKDLLADELPVKDVQIDTDENITVTGTLEAVRDGALVIDGDSFPAMDIAAIRIG